MLGTSCLCPSGQGESFSVDGLTVDSPLITVITVTSPLIILLNEGELLRDTAARGGVRDGVMDGVRDGVMDDTKVML